MKRIAVILWAGCILFLFPVLASGQVAEALLADNYFRDGEFGQALELYEKLSREDPGTERYVERATDCYRQLGQYAEGEKFLEKTIKRDPSRFPYLFLEAEMVRLQGRGDEAKGIESDVIYKRLKFEDEFLRAGAFLVKIERFDLALETYLQGRKELKNKLLFSGDVAVLYAREGQMGKAAEEYLNQYHADPVALPVLKTHLLNLVGPVGSEEIEAALLKEVQQSPNDMGIREMLFDFYVLTENFQEAFLQAKAFDKLFNDNGVSMFKFALTLRSNKEYTLSNKALDFIIDNRPSSPHYLKSFEEKTINSELQAFESIPVDTAALRAAVNNYEALLVKFGREPRFFNAMFRRANLLANYLQEPESAQNELDKVLTLRLQPSESAQAKLLYGDVLLMQKEYKKAELLYAEVASQFHDGQIGALAKFKEGRLYYFRGDFDMAKERLKSIKDNTSNDISNDAIQLFLTIQDNTGMDSTTTALEKFSQVQLLVFQRDFTPALKALDSLLFEFPNHPLTDEILWEKSKIFLQRGLMDETLLCLDKIIEGYGTDILGDDALYTKARIYDYTLKNKEVAMKTYIQFLTRYTGSLYIVEVRKRIRELRAEKGS